MVDKNFGIDFGRRCGGGEEPRATYSRSMDPIGKTAAEPAFHRPGLTGRLSTVDRSADGRRCAVGGIGEAVQHALRTVDLRCNDDARNSVLHMVTGEAAGGRAQPRSSAPSFHFGRINPCVLSTSMVYYGYSISNNTKMQV